jgi:uncharacterized protein
MTSVQVFPENAAGANTITRSDQITAFCAFIAITFGWSWGFWLIISSGGPWSTRVAVTLQILSGIGPSMAALIVVWGFDGTAGLKMWLARCFNWRLKLSWYGLAFFGPPLIMLAALSLNFAIGGATPPSPALASIGATVLQFAIILIVGGPLGEEFGWRGYALPALESKFGWRVAGLIVGAIWALWHLPLFYMAGSVQTNMPVALFMASTVALSVIFARLSVNTAFSVLPAIVLHWSVNAWSWAIPVTPNGASQQPYVIVVGLVFAVAIIMFLKTGPATRSLKP